jgi:hypothetical protein
MAHSLLWDFTDGKWYNEGTNTGMIPSYPEGEKMRKLFLLIPLLITILACNIAVSTSPTPTVVPPVEATLTFTPPATAVTQANGTVTGKLSYPSEFIPAMRVALFSLTDGKAYFVDTAKDQGNYSIEVPAGNYYVVSYPFAGTPGNTGKVDSYKQNGGPFADGNTQMVPCGLNASCNDHTLLAVAVTAGQTVTADPGDWYAPEGTFPPMPNP